MSPDVGPARRDPGVEPDGPLAVASAFARPAGPRGDRNAAFVTQAHVLALQRTAGNRATARSLGGNLPQPPAAASSPSHPIVVSRQRVQTISGRLVGDLDGADSNLREDVIRVLDNLHRLWSINDLEYGVEYAAVGTRPAAARLSPADIPFTIAALRRNEEATLNPPVARAVLGIAIGANVGAGQPNTKADILRLQDALHSNWNLTNADYAAERAAVNAGPDPVGAPAIPRTIQGIRQFKVAYVGGTSRSSGPMGGTSIPTPTAVGARDDALVTPGTTTVTTVVGGVTRHVPAGFRDVVRVGGVNRSYQDDLRQAIDSVLGWMYAQGQAMLARPRIGGGAAGDMTAFEPIGAAAKESVDAIVGVFGQFGPPFHSRVNLLDASQRPTDAADMLRYLVNNQRELGVVRARHNAVHAPGRPEAVIAENFMTAYLSNAANVTRLRVVDQTWPAVNAGGIVSLQPFEGPNAAATRRVRWDAFQTMIHEYFHSLNHPNYYRYADSLGGDDRSVLVEGGASLMTDYVWPTVLARVRSDAALRTSVEGRPAPFDGSAIPPIADVHYHPQFEQATDIAAAFGGENFRVAFLTGRMELIGYTREAPATGVAATGTQEFVVPPRGVRTLADVAYRTQTPIDELARLNALAPSATVTRGQRLRVRGAP